MKIGVTAFLTDRSMGPAEFAVAAEVRGFQSLYLPEHTHLPNRQDTPPGLVEGVSIDDYRRGLDPFVALAAAAAMTSTIRLGTGVCLVAQHDPIVLAKTVATLDTIARGRFTLGIGFGWNRAEAEDHGVEFSSRHARARDHVLCMQALWRDESAEYHGNFVDLPPCSSWPKPVQTGGVPILVGGGATDRVFAAITGYGTGWMPIGGSGLGTSLPVLREKWETAGHEASALAIVPFGVIADSAKLAHYAEIGVTEVVLRVPSGPPGQMLAKLDELARLLGG